MSIYAHYGDKEQQTERGSGLLFAIYLMMFCVLGFFFNMIVLLLLQCSPACDYSKKRLVFVLNVATLNSMLVFVLRRP